MTFSGTSTITGVQGYDIVQAINAYATCSIEIIDKAMANIATLKANPLKSVIKTHTIYNNVIFRGELREMSISYDRISYNAYDKSRKLLNQRANYNFIIDSGYIRNLTWDGTSSYRILDRGLSGLGVWDVDEHNGRIFHFQNTRKDKMRISPNRYLTRTITAYVDGVSSSVKTVSGTPAESRVDSGNEYNLYYNDEANDNMLSYNDTPEFFYDDYGIELTCYFAVKTDNTVKTIDSIELTFNTMRLGNHGITDNPRDPAFGLNVSGTTSYEVGYIKSEDFGSRFSGVTDPVSGLDTGDYITKIITKEDIINMEANPTKFMTTEIADDGDYTVYSIKIFVGSGQVIGGIIKNHIGIRSVYLNLTLDGDQTPASGQITIADTLVGSLVLSGTGRNPLIDGCSLGDYYMITDTLTVQINNLATAWGITINDDITNSDNIALTQDFTNKNKIDVLQMICDISNSVWWFDAAEDAYYIVSADNLVSSAVTITKNDIVGYLVTGAWSYKINADKIRDNVIIKGDSTTESISVTTTPEFAHALGDEDIMIVKPNVNSASLATQLSLIEAKKYERAKRSITFTLDYDNPNQSYTNLKIGNTVAILLPDATDTSVVLHNVTPLVGGVDDELLITQMQWIRKQANDNRRLVTITAELRNV